MFALGTQFEGSNKLISLDRVGAHVQSTTSLQSWIESPFSDPRFVLALAGIRQLVIRIKAVEKDDLIPF